MKQDGKCQMFELAHWGSSRLLWPPADILTSSLHTRGIYVYGKNSVKYSQGVKKIERLLSNAERVIVSHWASLFRVGCPAKLVSFRYNRNRNRKKFRNCPKQKDLFRFFQNKPKLKHFGSVASFDLTKKEPQEPK